MARPRKDSNKREKQLRARCTEAEFSTISARAERAGMTLSEYVRDMALSGKVEVQENHYDFQTVDQLRRIGINLNQLAKVANATGDIPPSLQNLTTRLTAFLDDFIMTT